MPNCEICGISVMKKPLYRNAPKGVTPARWRCLEHLDPEYKPDPTVQEISERLSNSLT